MWRRPYSESYRAKPKPRKTIHLQIKGDIMDNVRSIIYRMESLLDTSKTMPMGGPEIVTRGGSRS